MNPTGLAKRVVDDYTAWVDYTKGHRRRWERYWKQWNNIRVNPGYKSKAKVAADPMVHQVVETRVDNIYGSRPKWSFVPTMPEQETDTKILSEMAEYSWDKADMDLHIIGIGRETEITGNTIVFNGWEDGCMTYHHVPIADCIGDVAVASPNEAKKIGYRYLGMIDDLKKQKRFDPNAGKKDEDGNPEGEWVPKFSKNLSKVKTWTSLSEDPTSKQLADKIYNGSTLEGSNRDKQVEIIYMRYLDKFVAVANRQYVVMEHENPFQAPEREVDVQLQDDEGERMYSDENPPELEEKAIVGEPITEEDVAELVEPVMTTITVPAIEPFLGFAMGRGYVNPATLLSKGTVETITDLYEDLNDEVSIKKDNLISRQQNNALVDEDQFANIVPKLSEARANDFIKAAGIADGKTPVVWIDKPELSQDTDVEIARLKQAIRDTARVDQVVQGVSTENDRTATEIEAQVAGASSGFKTQTKTLGSGLYKMFGDNFYRMVQIFITKEQLVRVIGPKGVEFKKFDPNKYFGAYNCSVELKAEAEAMARQEAEKALAAYDRFVASGRWNAIELDRFVAEKVFGLDQDQIKLMMNPDPMNQAMMGGLPVGDVAQGSPMTPGPVQPQAAPMGPV
jgi:hypothetical protein